MQDRGKIEAARIADNGRLARAAPFGQDSTVIKRMIPKSGHRFSDKIMRD